MRFKEGVKVFGLQPVMIISMMVAQELYREEGNIENFIWTSCTDGKHKKGSDHYKGNAIDLRIWGFKGVDINGWKPPVISDKTVEEIAQELRNRLTDEYEVIIHSTHIHIGFDPQKGLNH